MKTKKTDKKAFMKSKAIWVVIVAALLLAWQLGLVLLAIKLMDIWRERSNAKIAANGAVNVRRRTTARAVRATQFLTPFLTLLGLALLVQGSVSHNFSMLGRGIVCITLALLFGLYLYQNICRGKRFNCYQPLLEGVEKVSLASLASAADVTSQQVSLDIQYLINHQSLEGARLDLNQELLYL